MTGEIISARTIRSWRHAVIDYSKHDIMEFEVLSDSQLIAAVSLAEVAKVTPREVCEWTVANAVSDVPTMRANWLPPTTYDNNTDLPVVSGLIRYADKHLPADARPRFDALISELRQILAQ